MSPDSMPKASCSTFTIGARQFVVHEPLEKRSPDGSITSSLTPSTTAGTSLEAGAEMITFARAGGQVLAGARRLGEVPCGFDDDIDPEFVPTDAGWLTF